MRAPQILVVEDSDLDFALIEMILQECRNPPHLLRAIDGEEAITLLHKAAVPKPTKQPDLVLLDVNLPRVNGLEVLEFIKSQEFLQDIPVVMFSSSRNAREKDLALDLGAADFLTKPLDLDLMTALLNDVCLKYLPPTELRQLDELAALLRLPTTACRALSCLSLNPKHVFSKSRVRLASRSSTHLIQIGTPHTWSL